MPYHINTHQYSNSFAVQLFFELRVDIVNWMFGLLLSELVGSGKFLRMLLDRSNLFVDLLLHILAIPQIQRKICPCGTCPAEPAIDSSGVLQVTVMVLKVVETEAAFHRAPPIRFSSSTLAPNIRATLTLVVSS